MASRTRLVPPSDLLSQVDGVEAALERGRRLGVAGWGAFALSAATAALAIARSLTTELPDNGGTRWAVVVIVVAFVVGLLLVNWTRFWVQASRKPFQYTYSIAPFEPVEGTGAPPALEGHADGPAEPPPGSSERSGLLAWLVLDLSERLSRRIARLSLLDERYSGTTEEPEAHIHIGGSYGIRENTAGELVFEVLPWIRLGPTGSPATVAHLVRFELPDRAFGPEEYEKLLERIYFSIATHLYLRIRKDVQRKIDLLPKRYFRASAYFYEARDYSRSNTLDAYEQARDLYREVLRAYDPSWWAHSPSRTRRACQRLAARCVELELRLRSEGAGFWPRLAGVELMVARAEIGYSRALLHRRALAGMSGQRLNTIFEARPAADSALERLSRLPKDVPGHRKARFQALVTLAAAYEQLGATTQAWENLKAARSLDPTRAEQNARYLHVRGRLHGPSRAILDLTRAVELDPAFEVAQFDLAIAVEMLWRSRATLEGDVADTVRREYDRVLTNNPGNISAWANLGYMHWLLGDFPQAKRALNRGREYKEIKRETFVSELDYGLARIAAEQGDFKLAYRHYIDAVSARFAQGVSHDPAGYTTYHFERITRDIVRRFERYKDSVHASWKKERDDRSQRVRDAVYAFVLNDYAEACFNYFLRSGNVRYLDEAKSVLLTADEELRARYAMIHYNLHLVLRCEDLTDEGVLEHAREAIDRAVELQPDWIDGRLQKAVWYRESARRSRELHRSLIASASESDRDRESLVDEAAHQLGLAHEALFDSRSLDGENFWSLLKVTAPPDPSESSVLPQAEIWPAGRAELPQRGPGAAAGGERPLEPETPPPLTGRGADFWAAGRGLDSLAKEGAGDADKERDRAAKHLEHAQDLEQEVAKILHGLLPHSWLVTDDGKLDLRVFSPGKPTRTRFERANARRMLQELDEIHVRTLVEWGLFQRSDVGSVSDEALREGDAERTAAKPEAGGRTAELEPGTDDERADVLRFVRKTFLPADMDVLREYRKLCREPGEPDSSADEERRVVRQWIEQEPAWWSLSHVLWPEKEHEELDLVEGDDEAPDALEQPLFDRETAREILGRVARTDRALPDSLFLWLGSELDALGHAEQAAGRYDDAKACFEGATSCYGRVARSPSADAAELVRLASRYDARTDLEYALRAYRNAEEVDKRDGLGAGDSIRYRTWAARTLWRLERYGDAVDELARVPTDGSVAKWREDFVGELIASNLVEEPGAYRLLKDWLGRAVTTAQETDEPVIRADAAAALLRLTLQRYQPLLRRRYQPTVGAELAELMTPSASQVILEADKSFFPADGDTPEVQRLVAEAGDIEKMRERIRERTGVVVPAVTILSTAGLGDGRYTILVEGVPIATARLDPGTRFCPAGAAGGADGLRGRPGIDPRDEELPEGTWLDDDEQAPPGVEVWDRYRFIVEHLEAVLLRCVDSLFGVQELENRLHDELPATAVGGSHTRVAAVLQTLLREGFALPGQLRKLSTLVDEHRSDVDLQEVVESVRPALTVQLLDAERLPRLVAVHPEIEDEIARWTRTGDGKRFLALPATEIDALRRRLAEQLNDANGDAALVVRTPHMRRFVRRLSEIDLPSVPVVAFDELPEDLRLLVHDTAPPGQVGSTES